MMSSFSRCLIFRIQFTSNGSRNFYFNFSPFSCHLLFFFLICYFLLFLYPSFCFYLSISFTYGLSSQCPLFFSRLFPPTIYFATTSTQSLYQITVISIEFQAPNKSRFLTPTSVLDSVEGWTQNG